MKAAALRADLLRRQFDTAFTEPITVSMRELVSVLSIRFGSARYLLRVSDLAGLFTDRSIAPLPSSDPEFLGVAGVRGSVVPVYDLRVILGHPVTGRARFLALAAGAQLAFAFDVIERHLQIPTSDIAPGARPEAMQHIAATAELEATAVPILDLTSVARAIAQRVGTRGHPKEH